MIAYIPQSIVHLVSNAGANLKCEMWDEANLRYLAFAETHPFAAPVGAEGRSLA